VQGAEKTTLNFIPHPDNRTLPPMFTWGVYSLERIVYIAGACGSKWINRKENTNIMAQPRKDCFGILDNVFPMGNEGLREIVPECFKCSEKEECLQAALKTEQGFELRSEALDRSSSEGLMGRLKRWSDKKALSKRQKGQRGERK